MSQKRKVDIVVISDVHIGTYGSKAAELLSYLRSIDPGTLVLNGDIFDFWHFSKRRFKRVHGDLIKELAMLIASGIQVHFITGNHDDLLRRITPLFVKNFSISDGMIINVGPNRVYFCHGDQFDRTAHWKSKIFGKLFIFPYNLLIWANKWINSIRARWGKKPLYFSKKMMLFFDRVFTSMDKMSDRARRAAAVYKVQAVVCSHSHKPCIYRSGIEDHDFIFMNSGDWVEHCSALEYRDGNWELYVYDNDEQLNPTNN